MIVVDTSYALQWVLDEPSSDKAEGLVAKEGLAAPDVLMVEAANVLAKKVRHSEIELAQAREGLRFLAARVALHPTTADLVHRAFELSVQLIHPVYDCVFLAFAEPEKAVLATRDDPFIKRVRAGGMGNLLMLP